MSAPVAGAEGRNNEIMLRDSPTDGVSSVCFAPHGDLLLASSWDSTLRLYDTRQNVPRKVFAGRGALLDCCFQSATSGFCGGLDKTVKQIDLETGAERVLGSHEKPVRCVEFDLSSGTVITGGWDQQLKAWDPRAPQALTQSRPLPGKVFTMSVTDTRTVVGTSGRHILVYDMRNLVDPEQRRESSLKYQTRTIRVFPDQSGYALGSVEGRVAVEYFDQNKEAQSKKYAFKCHRKGDQVFPVNAMAFHPVHGTFATGGCDKLVNMWDGKNKKRLWQSLAYPTGIAALAFNHDGSRLAVASSYTFEQGEIAHPKDQIFVRDMSDTEVKPKVRK
ncbi:unnamed protein product [Discosporangium mesarthrocarpum]